MDRLLLPRALKVSLHEIGSSGGNRDLYVEVDRQMLRHIREQFYAASSESKGALVSRDARQAHKTGIGHEFLERLTGWNEGSATA